MIRLALAILLALAPWAASAQPQAGAGDELALRLRDLVVPITAYWADGSTETGFGILVGRQGEAAIVATAGHVLAGGGPEQHATRVEIRLRQRPGRSFPGQRLELPATRLDLGVVSVPIPADVDWPRGVMAADPEHTSRGTPVWLIGQDGTWDVPTEQAASNRVSIANREIVFDGLDVGEGTSGAPLVSDNGLLGLIVRKQASRTGGFAIFITDIEAAFREWNLPWELSRLGKADRGVIATGSAPRPAVPSRAVGEVFRDTLQDGSPCPFCPEMVVVPAGSFTMGSTPEERKWAVDQGGKEEWYKGEQPAHPVRIAADFVLGRTEVTRGQFARFVDSTRRDMSGGCHTWSGSEWKVDDGKGWRDPGFDQDDTHPVICVSWEDATQYVAWLKQQTGQDYLLPSEAQWEYAARAGSTTMQFWGDDKKNQRACDFANVADRSFKPKLSWGSIFACDDGFAFTSTAGKYKASEFGLLDMLGSVWEWNQDCDHETYQDAPSNESAWIAGDCKYRILRGGSWYDGPRHIRSAIRGKNTPETRNFGYGFRVARMTNP